MPQKNFDLEPNLRNLKRAMGSNISYSIRSIVSHSPIGGRISDDNLSCTRGRTRSKMGPLLHKLCRPGYNVPQQRTSHFQSASPSHRRGRPDGCGGTGGTPRSKYRSQSPGRPAFAKGHPPPQSTLLLPEPDPWVEWTRLRNWLTLTDDQPRSGCPFEQLLLALYVGRGCLSLSVRQRGCERAAFPWISPDRASGQESGRRKTPNS